MPAWKSGSKHSDICMLIGHSKGTAEGVASAVRAGLFLLEADKHESHNTNSLKQNDGRINAIEFLYFNSRLK